MRKRLVEWRDSLVAACEGCDGGFSRFPSLHTESQAGQSAIDTDPGDTIKAGPCLSHALLERFNLKVTLTPYQHL